MVIFFNYVVIFIRNSFIQFKWRSRNTKGKGKLFPLKARLWPRVWVEVKFYPSMTTALEGVEQSAARPPNLPWERLGIHCTGGWVGPRAGLDRRKISPHLDSIPRPFSPQSLQRLSYPALLRGSFAKIDTRPPKTFITIAEPVITAVPFACANAMCSANRSVFDRRSHGCDLPLPSYACLAS